MLILQAGPGVIKILFPETADIEEAVVLFTGGAGHMHIYACQVGQPPARGFFFLQYFLNTFLRQLVGYKVVGAVIFFHIGKNDEFFVGAAVLFKDIGGHVAGGDDVCFFGNPVAVECRIRCQVQQGVFYFLKLFFKICFFALFVQIIVGGGFEDGELVAKQELWFGQGAFRNKSGGYGIAGNNFVKNGF